MQSRRSLQELFAAIPWAFAAKLRIRRFPAFLRTCMGYFDLFQDHTTTHTHSQSVHVGVRLKPQCEAVGSGVHQQQTGECPSKCFLKVSALNRMEKQADSRQSTSK